MHIDALQIIRTYIIIQNFSLYHNSYINIQNTEKFYEIK